MEAQNHNVMEFWSHEITVKEPQNHRNIGPLKHRAMEPQTHRITVMESES